MGDPFFEPSSEKGAETEVKKSRFLGTVRRVRTPEEAREAVRKERDLHPEARHVVYAFLVGDSKSETAGMSDDGEPKGTAGRPVFEVLKGSGVRNAVLTITRYFGGTKLGTGGLVKAYTECAQAVLRDLPTTRCVERRTFTLSVPYDHYESLRRILVSAEAEVLEEDFRETVSLRCSVPETEIPALERGIRDLTRGKEFPLFE